MKPSNETARLARWDKLISALRDGIPDVYFNMNIWLSTLGREDKTRCGTHCGTVACIGGHVTILAGYNADAHEWLGLDQDAAEGLFYGTAIDTFGSNALLAADFLESIKLNPPQSYPSMSQELQNFANERNLND